MYIYKLDVTENLKVENVEHNYHSTHFTKEWRMFGSGKKCLIKVVRDYILTTEIKDPKFDNGEKRFGFSK